MRIRILGSAAGGGLPQWNCRCPNCQSAREGSDDVTPRSQSSVAVSADGRNWFLLNVSPDVRQQIFNFAALGPPPGESRGTRIAGCVLTDAEIDHTSGLLLLREGCELSIYCTPVVRRWLNRALPLEPILSHFAQRTWCEIRPDESVQLRLPSGEPSGLVVHPLEMDPHVPKFVEAEGGSEDAAGSVIGLKVEDQATGRAFVYAPCVASITEPLLGAVEGAELVMIDGTFWDDEEPVSIGLGGRTARQMGHLPVSGDGGTLAWLSQLAAPERVYIHVNNTNPILRRSSPQAQQVRSHGIRVGADGDEFDL